ncbi:hypothetical protein ACWEPC_21660 [Nonomuraea sp. NPDC004297]
MEAGRATLVAVRAGVLDRAVERLRGDLATGRERHAELLGLDPLDLG